MNKLLLFLLLFSQLSFSQTVFGRWKTVDDISGKERGVVEIYEYNGRIFGRIIEIFDVKHKNNKCVNCEGEDKNKPILGLNFIKGLKKDGDEYSGGKILDPQSGKLYKCYINLESKDKLKVRGYIGISLFGRTQYWYRVK